MTYGDITGFDDAEVVDRKQYIKEKPNTAHWIDMSLETMNSYIFIPFKCSNCNTGIDVDISNYKYCPFCGYKIE